MAIRRALSLLLVFSACFAEPQVGDLFADAGGPDFAGKGLTTQLHSADDGRILARLDAEEFRGYQKSGTQELQGVKAEFFEVDLKIYAKLAKMLSATKVELRGEVRGELGNGRTFEAPSLTYSGKTRRLEIEGPAVFTGDGHTLTAGGGASTDERFSNLQLIGPVTGVARGTP